MLKNRLSKEGNETVTNLHGLKMLAEDGKLRFTDVAYIKIMARQKAEAFRAGASRAVKFVLT